MKNLTLLFITLSMLAAVSGCAGEGPELVGQDYIDGDVLLDSGNNSGDDVQADGAGRPDLIWYIDTNAGDSGTPDSGSTSDTARDDHDNDVSSTGKDTNTSWDTTAPDCDQEGITCIYLEHDHILVNGTGAVVDGSVVTINAAGVYSIAGTLDDGSIIVDTTDTDDVRLLFNGVQATSSTSSPLYIKDAGDVELFLVSGTMNSLTDATSYVYPTAGVDEPNAAIFSTADLDITGLGTMNVNGRFNDAINVKDGLDILGGTVIANGIDDGIRGKDNVSIMGGSVTVTATNNGIKSDNETDPARGFIEISAGTVKVTSGGDSLTASTSLTVSGGQVTTVSGGGSSTTVGTDVSAKGLKGIGSVLISGGVIDVDSADDGIHSDGPVTINGGDIAVTSGLDGIHATTILKVTSGEVDVISGGGSGRTVAADVSAKGLKGTLSTTILGGSFVIDAADDCVHSSNTVSMAGGTGQFDCRSDGIHAETILELVDGDYTIVTGGGSSKTVSSTSSAKGLKSGTRLLAGGGTFNLNCADDGVHSDSVIEISGGRFAVSSADDAFHAEESLKVTGGEIDITKSYEGLESKLITIDDGIIHIVSSDDGINVAGGDGSGGWTPGGGGSASYILTINGGHIWMNAGGDGLDSNGNMVINGGTVLVNGPVDNGNGPIDIGDGGSYYFKMNGGLVVAVGSSGMAVGNSTSSTQYGVLVNLTSSQAAGTIFHLRTSSGSERLTFKPAKKYQSVFFSSPEMAAGSYDVYLNGSSTGSLTDNLYTGGTYTAGTKYTTFTASSVATRIGSGGGPGF